jgi:hypothetical protein
VLFADLPPFGTVRSAAWIELTAASQRVHEFVATDVPGLCGIAEDAARALARIQRDHLRALDDAQGDTSRICDADQAFYADAEQATRVLLRRRASFTTMIFDDREHDPEDPPNDGTYEVGDADDPTFTGWVTEIEDNPFRVAHDRQCADGAWTNARTVTVAVYPIDTGTADCLEHGDRFRISLDGALVDPNGGPRGPVTLDGRFERCAFEVDPSIVAFLPFVSASSQPTDTDTAATETDAG